MHGSVHDFIVVSTVLGGEKYPTGHGTPNKVAGDFVGGMQSPTKQPKFKRVLDIGSLDICGNQRDYDFCQKGPRWFDLVGIEEYVGIDILGGKNVDIVMDSHALTFEDNSFDLVLCVSMLEHDSDPQKTISEAYRVTRKGQPFIMTTVSKDHEEHKHLGGGDTETYNFFTTASIQELFLTAGFKINDLTIKTQGTDIFVYAIKHL